jgi:predicted nucleic acid-binding protein
MRRFADTYFFLSLLNVNESAHAQSLQYAGERGAEVVTTEWVLMEVADGLASRGYRNTFVALLRELETRQGARVVRADHASFADAVTLYSQRPDKDWSLTDCTSFNVMTRLRLTEALTADHHFEQAGFIALLK